MEDKILNIEAAYRGVITGLIRIGFQVLNVVPINNGRYVIVKAIPENVMILYKRDFFNSFGKMFAKYGERGIGETINREELKEAARNHVMRIFSVFPNGVAYSISMENFINYAHSWINKEGKEVRSISIHRLKREFEL